MKRLAAILLMSATPWWCAFAMESNHDPVSIKFTSNDRSEIFLRITNTLEGEYTFSSNLKAVLSCRFLDFPTSASIQFAAKQPWINISTYSSLADPPGTDLTRLDEIKMKGREILEFPILYSHAIDMAKVRKLATETIPMAFRIQIPIMILKDGKQNQLVVISKWLSCP